MRASMLALLQGLAMLSALSGTLAAGGMQSPAVLCWPSAWTMGACS